MRAFTDFQEKITNSLNRHFFSRNSLSCSLFSDLDELIKQKESFMNYIRFEYTVAVYYNLLMSISSLFYIAQHLTGFYFFDKLTTSWLVFVSLVKLLETVPKFFLIKQIQRIQSQSINDDSAVMRRLMHLIRSNVFFYNTVLGYTLLASYSFFFLLFKRPSHSNPLGRQLYGNTFILFYGFFLRMIITFVNYHVHFKYSSNPADLANIDPFEEIKRVDSSLFIKLKQLTYQKEEGDSCECCCICMSEFNQGECIKVLPCSEKHVFHKACIETWLSRNVACPTCRKEVTDNSLAEKLSI
jgi:hypothetical protein